MMYQHMVDECLTRAYKELAQHKLHGRADYADHVQRRIDSLKRIRKKAPVANMETPSNEFDDDRAFVMIERLMQEMLW